MSLGIGRTLNIIEQALHKAAIARTDSTLTQKETESIAPNPAERVDALNFLLGTGMFKMLRVSDGSVSYRAVPRTEFDVKKDMGGEEAMVLNQIQAAGDQGIWTKHIKIKTELHQTVMDRCLKSLVQKKLVKTVPDVRHKTRKVYMLASLEPSVELTGGPWYTDGDLDSEFIELLCRACLQIIKERTFPKVKHTEGEHKVFYPPSRAPSYPTAAQIQTVLAKSKVTDTELSVEHVELLLGRLVLDGQIEKIPTFTTPSWGDNDYKEMKVSTGEKRANNRRGGVEEDDAPTRKRRRRDAEVIENEVKHEDGASTTYVYRAIREERVTMLCMEAPCMRCPTFDFCKPGGPVNPGECVYHRSWLNP